MSNITDLDTYEVELKLILDEIKRGKEPQGRKIEITLERYKAFWFYFLQTRLIEWSYDKANISEQTWRTLKPSLVLQRLLELRSDDLKAVAMINISKRVRGKEAVRDENGNIIVPALEGDIDDSKWLLSQVYKVGKEVTDKDDIPLVGAPRNESEAELMAKMLNWHYDYRNKNTTDSE